MAMNNPYLLTPKQIDENHWSVMNAAGEEKAYAVRNMFAGSWTAYLRSNVGNEWMSFLSSRSDNPASALSNLLAYNLELARGIVSELEEIDSFMDLSVFDEEEEAEVEVDILATV